ncbi:Regulatory protein PchR [compost metagenome]
MNNYHLCGSGLFLMHSAMEFSENVTIETGIEGESIASQFVFYHPKGTKIAQGGSRHNIRFIPSSTSRHELKADMEYTYFLMVISKEYYYRLIDKHSTLHEDFVQEIDKGLGANFSQVDMRVTPEMHRIIDEIVENKKVGELKRLHTEAKVLELLIYQIEQLNNEQPGAEKFLKDEDIAKLEMARDILEQNFISPPTQRELALEVMLNESKLRKGFKEYFASTIYDYITRLRMELAKQLLIDDQKSIFEVANLTGFKHQANFSIAFKKYFGISPSEII